MTVPGGIAQALFINGPGSINNSGTATANTDSSGGGGGIAQAIDINGPGSVVNSGTATGSSNGGSGGGGGIAEAIFINGAGSVVNSGTATASANGGSGGGGGIADVIFVNGAGSIANSGTATASSNGGSGGGGGIADVLFVNGAGSIVNSGKVVASANGGSGAGGGIADAVFVNGAGSIVNSGTVIAISNGGGGIAQGLSVSGSGSSIANSGTVIATADGVGGIAQAINLFGNNSTLTLLPGSFIVGSINLSGTNDVINMNAGNQNLTFGTLAGVTVTGNVPFAVVGNRIVSVDPTLFAMQGRALNDFTREVSSTIPQLPGGLPTGGAPLAFAAPDASSRVADAFASIPGLMAYSSDTMVFKNPTVVYSDGSTVWGRGFAGNRVQQADGVLQHAADQFYGGMLGGDMRVRPDLRIGGFIGLGNDRSWVNPAFAFMPANFSTATSDLVFGDAYAQYDQGATFVRAAVQVGGSHNSTTRTVNNNLLANGLETATASFNGWYVSPEASIGRRVALGQLADASYMLTPSLKLRYLYGAFDGYTETGTTAPLTIGSRNVGTAEERGELKLTRTVTFSAASQLSTSLYGGVLGTQRAGDSTINAAALGQPFPFASPGPASVWGGFGGGGVEWRARNVTLFSAAEYLALSDRSNVVSGRAGLRVSF